MSPGLRRRIALMALLAVLGLLRAEQGVAEIQGRGRQPSRILRLATDGAGTWEVALLGFQRPIRSLVVLVRMDRPLVELRRALPWR